MCYCFLQPMRKHLCIIGVDSSYWPILYHVFVCFAIVMVHNKVKVIKLPKSSRLDQKSFAIQIYKLCGPKKFSLMRTTQGFRDRQGRPILPAQVTNQKTLWLILMRWKDLARGHYWWPVPVTGRSDCAYHIHFLVVFFFFHFFCQRTSQVWINFFFSRVK